MAPCSRTGADVSEEHYAFIFTMKEFYLENEGSRFSQDIGNEVEVLVNMLHTLRVPVLSLHITGCNV